MEHILLLSNIFPTSGTPLGATFVKSRIRALETLGFKVTPVAVGPRPPKNRNLKPVEFVDATVEASPVRRLQLRARTHSKFLEQATITSICSQVDLDSVDGIMAHGMFSLGAGHVGAKIAQAQNVPYSVHLHGSDVNVVMRRSPRLARGVLNEAAGCVFVSRALRDSAVSLGYTGKNSVVTGNGVDLDIFTTLEQRKTAVVPPPHWLGEPRVLFVGNLLPVKGADLLPKIFAEFCNRYPRASLGIAGDGPLFSQVASATEGAKVAMHGRIPPVELSGLMASSDLVILPSRSEGWPTVINEAYATGTPVVAADVGGVREALIDDKWAIKVDGRFVSNFVRAMDLALTDYNAGHVLRERAEAFSWDAIIKKEIAALGGSNAESV